MEELQQFRGKLLEYLRRDELHLQTDIDQRRQSATDRRNRKKLGQRNRSDVVCERSRRGSSVEHSASRELGNR
jgi:hypothetical protein